MTNRWIIPTVCFYLRRCFIGQCNCPQGSGKYQTKSAVRADRAADHLFWSSSAGWRAAVLFASGYGVFNGIGNLFLLISLVHLPASVQYPLVTGGVMLFSTLISALRKEKIEKKEYIAAVISFAASVLMAF